MTMTSSTVYTTHLSPRATSYTTAGKPNIVNSSGIQASALEISPASTHHVSSNEQPEIETCSAMKESLIHILLGVIAIYACKLNVHGKDCSTFFLLFQQIQT